MEKFFSLAFALPFEDERMKVEERREHEWSTIFMAWFYDRDSFSSERLRVVERVGSSKVEKEGGGTIAFLSRLGILILR